MIMEIMVPNAAVRNLIREDKVHQIYSVMQTGQGVSGMQTMNQALFAAYSKRQIKLEDALARSPDVNELQSMIEPGRTRSRSG
jgi:twitching motility protein PilT